MSDTGPLSEGMETPGANTCSVPVGLRLGVRAAFGAVGDQSAIKESRRPRAGSPCRGDADHRHVRLGRRAQVCVGSGARIALFDGQGLTVGKHLLARIGLVECQAPEAL